MDELKDIKTCPSCGAKISMLDETCPYCGEEQPLDVFIPTEDDLKPLPPPTSKKKMFYLCLFLGWLGVHRFYCGKKGTGLLWLLTLGIGGFGWVADLFMIFADNFHDANGQRLDEDM